MDFAKDREELARLEQEEAKAKADYASLGEEIQGLRRELKIAKGEKATVEAALNDRLKEFLKVAIKDHKRDRGALREATKKAAEQARAEFADALKAADLKVKEINDELEDLIMEGFDRAGVGEKVSLIIGDAKESLAMLRKEILEDGARPEYDLVYIDANKREYPEYYGLVFDIVKAGGYILADNVLWDGKVLEDPMPTDRQTLGIAEFNDMVARDPRVESVIIPVRDGLNFIRKL